MSWDKIQIETPAGEIVDAQAPVIISASRSTDIPAFYADWFMHRLKEGYVKWKNPFNGVYLYVSFAKTRMVVFWSKNPKPMLPHLDYLDQQKINYYFQFTLNDYDAEKLEPKVPSVKSRIDTFIELSDRIGKDKVIWRFDPLILTSNMGVVELLNKIDNIGSKLMGYTNKFVFSFADIGLYKKVKANLSRSHVEYIEFDDRRMNELATGIQQLNKKWNFKIATCAESIDLKKYGIDHNKCVDDDLMIELFPQDKALMTFLGVRIIPPDLLQRTAIIEKTKNNKDKGQRLICGCINSKDIGEYNTCPHLCEYCYANASKGQALANWERHMDAPFRDTITGD